MPDYNFFNLSPSEFEELSRDILQKHLGVTLESFTSGRDGGIDLRHSTDRGKTLIIQCKRYTDYKSLYATLKKDEVIKVAKLKPSKYILTTSVGLSPAQKKEIKLLFKPFIKNTSDILGRDDLNNLLGIHKDIEKQHFKLWLSSVNVLENILHSKIHNQTSFEKDKITETIRLYVENTSYYNAIDIIKSKRYVIISGMPGIGKTTLARILSFHYLATGFEEFVYVTNSISEAFKTYKEGIKQIFLFDDFLGRNFLENRLTTNEERQIVDFISKISGENDKILILVTREYILTQAKLRYDIFDNPSLEFSKCIIDLSNYTKIIRSKILYNHLSFSLLTPEYIEDILRDKNYNKVITHNNYNPRIIQTITNPDIWKTIEPSDFSSTFLEYLDNPENIWKAVFESQISKLSQIILANLLTTGTPILGDDLKDLVQKFTADNHGTYGTYCNEIEFDNSIRELENTFIATGRTDSNDLYIEYQNPSVQDFLVNYFSKKPKYIEDLIKSSMYFNQLYKIFATDEYLIIKDKKIKRKNKIVIKGRYLETLINKITQSYDTIKSSEIKKINIGRDDKSRWYKLQHSEYTRLDELTMLFLDSSSIINVFITDKLIQIAYPSELDSVDLERYINLIMYYKDYIDFDEHGVLTAASDSINSLQDAIEFDRLSKVFTSSYNSFIRTNHNFTRNISKLLAQAALNTEDNQASIILDEIESVGEIFDIDYSQIKEELEERISNYQEYIENQIEDYDWRADNEIDTREATDDFIENMFDSLKS